MVKLCRIEALKEHDIACLVLQIDKVILHDVVIWCLYFFCWQ